GKADDYTNKNMKEVTEWVQRPQVGAKGLVYIQWKEDGSIKSTVGKFYNDEVLRSWITSAGGGQGDILFLMSGEVDATRTQLGTLRLELARRYELYSSSAFSALWVVDFPLLEWDKRSIDFMRCIILLLRQNRPIYPKCDPMTGPCWNPSGQTPTTWSSMDRKSEEDRSGYTTGNSRHKILNCCNSLRKKQKNNLVF